MKKGLTELVFIVDRSGSMAGLETDTIGGINATLEKNRAIEGEANVSIVLFDNVSEVLVDRKPLSEVGNLTENDYWVRGCTALLDAVGGAIKHTSRVQDYMPSEYKAEHVIFVITTDGYENASTEYSYKKVKKLIEKRTKEGWEFIFLGANIDAVSEAARIGIGSKRAVTYLADTEGSNIMHEAVSVACCSIRDCGELDANWKVEVEADTAARG